MRHSPVILLVLSCTILFGGQSRADDGYSELGAGGLVFSKSDAISMDKEVLEISPSRVSVSYEFRNNTDKDVDALVAFPLPPIKCGWFDRNQYPDGFDTTVDGGIIHMQIDAKAFVRSDKETSDAQQGRFKPGEDVTALLTNKAAPVDCRLAVPTGKHFNEMTENYKKISALGLASADINNNPYRIYYQTELKYFWKQRFPKNSVVHISHSYRPAYGMSVIELPTDYYPAYLKNILLYRQFFADHPQLAAYKDADANREDRLYLIVSFILKSANSWDGPIKDFQLVLKGTPAFFVASLDGNMSMDGDKIVIEKRQFTPTEDLQVFYVADANIINALDEGKPVNLKPKPHSNP